MSSEVYSQRTTLSLATENSAGPQTPYLLQIMVRVKQGLGCFVSRLSKACKPFLGRQTDVMEDSGACCVFTVWCDGHLAVLGLEGSCKRFVGEVYTEPHRIPKALNHKPCGLINPKF